MAKYAISGQIEWELYFDINCKNIFWHHKWWNRQGQINVSHMACYLLNVMKKNSSYLQKSGEQKMLFSEINQNFSLFKTPFVVYLSCSYFSNYRLISLPSLVIEVLLIYCVLDNPQCDLTICWWTVVSKLWPTPLFSAACRSL